MTADTTTAPVVDQCVTCRKSTAEPPRRVERRAFATDDGTVRYMCQYCWAQTPLDNLRGRRWLPAHSSNQPPPPPRQAPSRRRTDVRVQGACVMCGVEADPDWQETHFTLGGVAILGPRCAPCDGGIAACGYDAALYLADVHGRQQLTFEDCFAGVVWWHQREGVRPPPPAAAPWAF